MRGLEFDQSQIFGFVKMSFGFVTYGVREDPFGFFQIWVPIYSGTKTFFDQCNIDKTDKIQLFTTCEITVPAICEGTMTNIHVKVLSILSIWVIFGKDMAP